MIHKNKALIFHKTNAYDRHGSAIFFFFFKQYFFKCKPVLKVALKSNLNVNNKCSSKILNNVFKITGITGILWKKQ